MSSSLLLHRRGRWGGALVAALLLAAPLVGSSAAGADTEVSFVTQPDSVVGELSDTTKANGKDEGTAAITVLNSTSIAACVRVTLSAPPMYGPLIDGQLNPLDVDPTISSSGNPCEDDQTDDVVEGDFAEASIEPGKTAEFELVVPDAYTGPFTLVASTGAGAEARMVVPDRAEPVASTTAEWGQEWWDKDLAPALQLGVEVVLLLLVVSLLANWAADEWTRVWRVLPRPAWFRMVGYLVVAAGGLRLLLLHTPRSAMASWVARRLAFQWWLLAAVVMAVLIGVALGWLAFHRRSGTWFAEKLRNRVAWGIPAVFLPLLAFGMAGWGQGQGGLPWYRGALVAVGIVLIGGFLIAWQSAYLPRLRITSGDEKDDAWAARRERLAGEILGQGPGDQTRITVSGSADGSPLSSDALAAAGGAGPALKAIVAIVNAILPHAGLELRVTALSEPDPGDDKAVKADPRLRLTASLNRGRHEIATEVFDSRMFHPAYETVDKAAHDSEIDALSAVAAWARAMIAAEMKDTPWSLYGATSWQSIALHRAGVRRDDDGDHAAARSLLARAEAEDPANLQTRLNFVTVSAGEVFGREPAGADAAQLVRKAEDIDRRVRHRFPGTPLALRARYVRAAVHLYAGNTEHAARAAAGLLGDLDALGADPFGYLTGNQAIVDEARIKAANEAGDVTPWRFSEQPHLDDRRGLEELARYIAPSAAVLWLISLDRDDADRQVWLDALHKRLDLPYRARYNLGCAFVAAGQFDKGWADVRDAMAVYHLGYWALRDPSLKSLWRERVDKSSTDGKTYLDLYVERLDELGRKPRLEKGSALVDAGLAAGLVLKLAMLHDIDSAEKLKNVDDLATLTSLTEEQRDTLAKKKGTLALAAVPAIGAANADLLATAGITSSRALIETSTGQVVERVAAAGQATGKDTTKLTYTTIRGWQLAARDVEPPHHEIVGIMTGDGTVVLVES